MQQIVEEAAQTQRLSGLRASISPHIVIREYHLNASRAMVDHKARHRDDVNRSVMDNGKTDVMLAYASEMPEIRRAPKVGDFFVTKHPQYPGHKLPTCREFITLAGSRGIRGNTKQHEGRHGPTRPTPGQGRSNTGPLTL